MALDGGLGERGGENGDSCDFLGGGEVLFHQDGREREDVADVVEAVAGVVGGEIGGGLEVDGEEIADGVVVFEAIEAAGGDAAGVGGGMRLCGGVYC